MADDTTPNDITPNDTVPNDTVPNDAVPNDTVPNDAVAKRSEAHGDPLRASNAERETALNLLAAHYADGRLERAEFDERADAALAARTRDDLRTLFVDLPGHGPVPARASEIAAATTGAAPQQRRSGAVAPGFPFLPRILVPILFVAAVLAALHGNPPFPLIPLVFILTRRHRRWNREARPWT